MEATPVLPDDGVAKNLFGDTPSDAQKRKANSASPPSSSSNSHYDIWRYKSFGRDPLRKPRMGFCGAVIFFTLCLAAVILTVQFNTGEWRTVMTAEGSVD